VTQLDTFESVKFNEESFNARETFDERETFAGNFLHEENFEKDTFEESVTKFEEGADVAEQEWVRAGAGAGAEQEDARSDQEDAHFNQDKSHFEQEDAFFEQEDAHFHKEHPHFEQKQDTNFSQKYPHFNRKDPLHDDEDTSSSPSSDDEDERESEKEDDEELEPIRRGSFGFKTSTSSFSGAERRESSVIEEVNT